MTKPFLQPPKGFRDFLPDQKRARDFVVGKLKSVFERFGFEPLETPTLEYADLLLGKYGTDADKLIYNFTDRGGRQVGLRYDQTVPTARVLAQYQGKLPKYFRRYQIQNVFRADKPQAGRYREFCQCDADIFGSYQSQADAEILTVYYSIYKELGFTNLVIKLNDRQTLYQTLAPFTTQLVPMVSIIQSLDKIDKIGSAGVITELTKKGLTSSIAEAALTTINQSFPSPDLIDIITNTKALGVPDSVLQYSPTLARGLDYYTGLIFEGVIQEYDVGSVGGGGRYDKLLNDLAGVNIPAVGFGLGFDRTVDAALKLNLIPPSTKTTLLLGALDLPSLPYSLNIAAKLRDQAIACEVYPEIDKPGKLVGYANKGQYAFVILIGNDELTNQTVTLKNLKTGEQKTDTLENVIPLIKAA